MTSESNFRDQTPSSVRQGHPTAFGKRCNASCSVGSVGAASCPPSIGGFGSTSTLAIEGDPVAIAAQTSTQRECVVKDSLGRTGARFGVLLLHMLSSLHKSRRDSNRCSFFAGTAGGFCIPRVQQ